MSRLVRDDFAKATIERLAKRVGFLCSNPHCRNLTVGAAQGHEGVVNIGMAAHITAAAPGGPRYDATLSPEQRRHQSNGIWLCQTHGKLVDSDEGHFTVAMLREWKERAEADSFRALLSVQGAPVAAVLDPSATSPIDAPIDELVRRIRTVALEDLQAFRRIPGWPDHPIDLNLRLTSGDAERQFSAQTVGSAVSAFNELVIVAPPGTGKTTTLLQINDAILAQDQSIAVFVPLGEWALQAGSLFDSIVRRRAFASATPEDLALLAESGRLILTLDGWNELDETSRAKARSEIQRLKRDFPDVGIIISTRRQALDVPIAAPIVSIDLLSHDQQLELARALSAARGESLLDHAWRTPGVRELVAIPLYLTALVTRTTEDPFPTTREEIIRLFINEHEAKPDRAEELRRLAFGLHPQILTALAVEGTRTSSATISDAHARAAVARGVTALLDAGQLTARLQPATILDGLISHHLLVKSSDGIAFQHQQFQEWYASHDVERLMLRAAQGEPGGRELLRRDILNERSWEESILFACERLSRRDSISAHAVAGAIQETLNIDPMLAAQMIYRSSDAVWALVKDATVSFASSWHVRGEVDRAVAFMITTGRGEFAADVWPLVASEDDQVSYRALRCADRFRPSVLGSNARDELARLPDEVRKVVLHEIAFYSGMDGIELATEIARHDASVSIQIAVVEALLFRRADRFAAAVLRQAPDDVWQAVAKKGYYVARVSEPDVSERLQRERFAIIDSESDPLRKLAMLLDEGFEGADVGAQISSLIQTPDFPGRDEYGGVARAYQLYPREVTSAFVHRLERALEVPYWAHDVLRTASVAIDEGPLVDLVLRPETPRFTANHAAVVAGPMVIGRLLDELVTVHGALRAMPNPVNEETRQRFWRLEELVANANETSLARAVITRPRTGNLIEIALLADQIARHPSREGNEKTPLRISENARRELVDLVAHWAEALIASTEAGEREFAEVARAIRRVASPDLLETLQRLLEEDRRRGRASREAHAVGLERHALERGDVHMTWATAYRDAFAAIGGSAVATLMISYLRDVGYYGFGTDAASVLRQMWKTRRTITAGDADFDSPFSSSRQKVIARHPDKVESPDPYAEAILGVVDDLVTSTDEESQRHALLLATVAFTMPYGNRRTTIHALLQLRQPPSAKRGLLRVLAEAGETVPGDLVFAGLHQVLEEAKAKPWMLSDQNGWQLREWLGLVPFSDRAGETLDALALVSRPRDPWQMRGILSALGRSPSPAADEILRRLARDDPRYLDEHDWFEALSLRGSVYAARVVLEFILEGSFVGRKKDTDPLFVARKLALGTTQNEVLRREVYQHFERAPSGPSSKALEYAIAEAPDDDGILVLIRAYVNRGQTDLGAIHDAIRHLAVGERPSETMRGAVEQFSIGLANLRRRLFALVLAEGPEGQLAGACLTLIDELRDDHGAAEAEPRHPDITADRPWPMVM